MSDALDILDAEDSVTWAEYRQAIEALTEEAWPIQLVERIGSSE